MNRLRYWLWIAVAVVVAGAGLLYFLEANDIKISGRGIAQVGGPFELVRADGTTITDKDIAGRPYAMFFGFTHCPEVCPTTLYEATGWREQLGETAADIDFYFVTVDPERDTPEVLANYISAFPGITAIGGQPEAVARMLKAYRVYAKKVPTDDGEYTMDHTATVYLMDAGGQFAGTIAWQENSATAIEKLRRLAGQS